MNQRYYQSIGKKYNRLYVLSYDKTDEHKKTYVNCLCDCGKTISVRLDHLKSNRTKSCGCLQKEQLRTHNLSYTRVYNIWTTMKQRCYNKNNTNHANYVDRGITVCEQWLNNFKVFYDWAIDNGYKDNLQIDRINTNGNYEPSNCRWVTPLDNSNNKRNNRFITYKGETKTIAEWGRIYNINRSVLRGRLNRHWDIEKALTTPIKHYKKRGCSI